jgi:hypothetical protein
MNDSTTSTAGGAGQGREPTEEEMRAALEAEMKRIKVDDVLLQTVVSLINLGGRRAGLAPGTEGERDLDQVRTAIEAVRALMPLLEANAEVAKELGPIRDALSQLQMAYAQLSGGAAAEGTKPEEPPKPGEEGKPEEGGKPGPAQSSGRLWVPGQ